jgi:branched-chain amino acid transport system substrate-binding protein
MKKIFKRLYLFLLIFFISISFAIAQDTIKIGVQAPITGKFAYEGQGMLKAAQLLVEQQNAKGGITGKQIELLTCDDEGAPMKSAICAKELVSKGAVAVVGAYTSSCAASAQETYQQGKVLFISATSSDDLTEKGFWTYIRSAIANWRFGVFAADYFVDFKKYKRIALISDFSSYSEGMAKVTEKYIKEKGGNVIVYEKIKSGDQNFTPVLTRIKSLNPDAIYFTGYYSDGGIIRAQQVQLGIKADFIGGESNDNEEFYKLAGSSLEGTYVINVPTPEMLPWSEAKAFGKDYEAKYKEKVPSIITSYTADGFALAFSAMNKVKSTDAKTVTDYLHSLRDFPGTTGPISFDNKGDRTTSGAMTFLFHKDASREIVYPKIK